MNPFIPEVEAVRQRQICSDKDMPIIGKTIKTARIEWNDSLWLVFTDNTFIVFDTEASVGYGDIEKTLSVSNVPTTEVGSMLRIGLIDEQTEIKQNLYYQRYQEWEMQQSRLERERIEREQYEELKRKFEGGA